MDQVGFLAPPAPGPAPPVEYVPSLAGHIVSCILSCAANSDLFNERSFSMLHPGVSANLSALEQISVLLEDHSLVPTVKHEGKRSVEALADRLRSLCRGVAIILLKAGGPPSDEADLSALTDRQMVQKLNPRHLASVIRGERHKWLKPRVALYVEELETLAIDLVLHTYVFRLAKMQMSMSKATSGGFEEELAVRAFAQRFLALRQTNWEKRQADHEKRYRLREVSSCSDTCSIASSSSRARRRDSSSDRCPSESGSRASTVVEKDRSAVPPPPPGPPEPPVVKVEVQPVPPGPLQTVPLAQPQTTEPVQQPQVEAQSSKKVDKPGLLKKNLVNLHHRAWRIFSRDAATLRSLNYHGKPPQIEAWVISENMTCVFQRRESGDELLREIRRHVKNGTDSFWDAALGLSIRQRNVLEFARAKAIETDRRSRQCIFVSDWNNTCEKDSGAVEHRTVYFVVGDVEDPKTVLITDPNGEELHVPVGSGFWPSVLTAWLALPQNSSRAFTRQSITRGSYRLIAEDGSEIRYNSLWSLLRPGKKYQMVPDPPRYAPAVCGPPGSYRPTCGPRPGGYNPTCGPRPGPPPRPSSFHVWPRSVPAPPDPPTFRRPVPIRIVNVKPGSDSDDDDDGEVTWEIVQELGFEDRKPASTAKLSELLAAWTNAPDTECDADISESVLGPVTEVDCGSSLSSGSGTTVD